MKRRTPPAKVAYGSLAELAAATGLSARHWRRAIESGDLPAKRSGRNSDGHPAGNYVTYVRDVDAYLDQLPEA